jgi:hypothetical protein
MHPADAGQMRCFNSSVACSCPYLLHAATLVTAGIFQIARNKSTLEF